MGVSLHSSKSSYWSQKQPVLTPASSKDKAHTQKKRGLTLTINYSNDKKNNDCENETAPKVVTPGEDLIDGLQKRIQSKKPLKCKT